MTEGSTHNGRKALAYTPRTPWAMPKGTMALAIRATAAHTAPSSTWLPPDSCPTPARLLLESCPQRGALCPDGPRSPTAWTPYACRGRSEAARELARVLNGCPRTQRAFPFRYRSRPCRRGAPPAEGIVRHCFSVFSVLLCLRLSLSATGPQARRARQTGNGAVRVGVEAQPRCKARQMENGVRHDVGRSARAGL